MKLIRGDNLSPTNKAEVLRAYVYRLTTENGYPQRNPCNARVPAITDAQWLREHAFHVTRAGTLSRKHTYAQPACMVD